MDERSGREAEEGGGGRTLDEAARTLSALKEDVGQLKRSLADLVRQKRAATLALTRVVEGRAQVGQRRRVYEESKRRLRLEYEELQQVARGNQRREDRLAKVRGKNFSAKLEGLEEECGEQRAVVVGKRRELQAARRQLVSALQTSVFPVEVQPLSLDDAGEEDYLQASVIDCDTAQDVDDGWVLSGVHRSPTPHITIVTASMPLDGDYSAYLEAVRARRRALKTAAESGTPLPPVTHPGSPPQLQPYLSVPAGLQFTAQLVELVAGLLDTPLPYPLHRHLYILEYSNQNRRRRDFLDSVARLDDNIMYLCFSQNLPLSALSTGHTLSNLLALVTHTELGRQGAFECHPELAVSRGSASSSEVVGDLENEPPSFYTADQTPGGQGEDNSDSEMEEEEEEEEKEKGEEWESVDARSAADQRRGRRRGRMGYESSYLDYMAMGTSRGAEGEGQGQEEAAGGVGLFGTLSSLLSSTFRST